MYYTRLAVSCLAKKKKKVVICACAHKMAKQIKYKLQRRFPLDLTTSSVQYLS